MIRNSSPTKRKRSEFHDPDYPAEKEEGDVPGVIKRKWDESQVSNDPSKDVFHSHKLFDIVSREFQIEINYKEQQLEIINKRLLHANQFLDQLRYGIVAKHYQKQQISLTKTDADKIRGKTLFNEEKSGPQMPMHPALKKIVGKKPFLNDEYLKRVCRERVAANNARQTIRARSNEQLREERRLKRLIKAKGIVIDHSQKQEENKNLCILEQNVESVQSKAEVSGSKIYCKALNVSRMNNRERQIFVVANTSQYIGNDIENSQGKSNDLPIIYKWLVYVRLKDNIEQIGKYVKKVRFYLHHSYRPNDIIDVCSPPFQIARRGWGEFPIRIQLFFNEIFQQKPIQLVHNIVLDKKFSGIHTLGAETLVEVWLRTNKTKKMVANENEFNPSKIDKEINEILHNQTKKEHQVNVIPFVNKFEEKSSSLREQEYKIEPKVFMNKKLDCAINHQQISNNDNTATESKNSIGLSVNTTNSSTELQLNAKTFSTPKTYTINNRNTQSFISEKRSQENNSLQHVSTKQPEPNLSNVYISTQATASPMKNPCLIKCSTTNNLQNSRLPQDSSKKFIPKKIVRLINTQGKMKYVEMLVATSIVPKSKEDNKVPPVPFNSIQNKITVSTMPPQPQIHIIKAASSDKSSFPPVKPTRIVSTTEDPVVIDSKSITLKNSSASMSSYKTEQNQISEIVLHDQSKPANMQNIGRAKCATTLMQKNYPKIVFQKEGKLYIVDPIQMRLKQEQRKQFSLLKPQMSLLKNNMNSTKEHFNFTLNEMSVTQRDHDYTATTLKITAPSTNFERLGQLNEMRNQQQRYTVEKEFLCTKFENMRSAIEYLLRRIPIISGFNRTHEMSLPFICSTLNSFQNLTVFKQRCYEWLRAKYFARLIRHHPKLKELSISCKEAFWSTREIAKFADQYNLFPNKKSIAQPSNFEDSAKRDFTVVLKDELSLERQLQNGTITPYEKISKWMVKLWDQLELYKTNALENNFVVVDDYVKCGNCDVTIKSSQNFGNAGNFKSNVQIYTHRQKKIFLRTPQYLENENEIVRNACREIGICLEPEIVDTEKIYESSNIVLAQCLRVFIDKLLHYTLAIKRNNIKLSGAINSHTKSGTATHAIITTQDIREVIVQSQEFNFLSNFFMGVSKTDDSEILEKSALIKTETVRTTTDN